MVVGFLAQCSLQQTGKAHDLQAILDIMSLFDNMPRIVILTGVSLVLPRGLHEAPTTFTI